MKVIQYIKDNVVKIGVFILTILGFFYIKNIFGDKQLVEDTEARDSELKTDQIDAMQQVDEIKKKIEKIKDEGVQDMTPSEVEDYWKNNLKH